MWTALTGRKQMKCSLPRSRRESVVNGCRWFITSDPLPKWVGSCKWMQTLKGMLVTYSFWPHSTYNHHFKRKWGTTTKTPPVFSDLSTILSGIPWRGQHFTAMVCRPLKVWHLAYRVSSRQLATGKLAEKIRISNGFSPEKNWRRSHLFVQKELCMYIISTN